MATRRCCIRGCLTTRQQRELTLFRVPADPNSAFRLAIKPYMITEWIDKPNIQVCELHFESKNWEKRYLSEGEASNAKKLLPGAVPTLFQGIEPMNVDPCHPCIKSEDQIQCPQGDQPQTHTQSLSENQPYSLPSFYLNIPIILNPGQIALSIPSLVDFSGSVLVEGSSSEAIQSTETSPVQPGNLRNPGKDLEMTPSLANYTHPLLPLLSTGIAVQSNERTPIQSDDELSGPDNLPKMVESIIDLTDPLETLQDTEEVESETDHSTETAPVLIDNLSCLKNIEYLEDDTVPEENDAIENTRESIEPEDKDYLQDPERQTIPIENVGKDNEKLFQEPSRETVSNSSKEPFSTDNNNEINPKKIDKICKSARKPLTGGTPRTVCCIKSCLRRRPLYKFPGRWGVENSMHKRRKQWLQILTPYMMEECINRKLVYICERHFSPEDFVVTSGKNKELEKSLKLNALPLYQLELDPLAVPHADHQYLPLSYPKDTSTNQEEDPKVVIRTEEPGPLFVGLDMKNQPSCEDQTKEANEFPGIPELDTRCRICLAVAIEGVPLDRDFAIDGLESEKFTIIQELKRLDSNILLGDCRPQQICAKCFEHLKLMVLFRRRYEKTQKMLDDLTGPLEAKAIQATETSQVFEDDLNCPEKIAEYLDNSLVLEDQEIVEYLEEYIESAGKDFLQSSKTSTTIFGNIEKNDQMHTEETSGESVSRNTEDSENANTEVKDIYPLKYCYICEISFPSEAKMMNHAKKEHPDVNAFKCLHCSKTYATRGSLKNHIRSLEERILKYECHYCEKRFEYYNQISRHLKLVHLYGDFKCEHCHKKIKKYSHFIYHLKWHQPKKYQCQFCPKGFLQKHHLTNHEATHTGIRAYLCTICGTSTKSSDNLKNHMRVHYKSDLICDFCGKSFENLNDLKNHKLTHSDLAFICSICGDSFKQKRRYQEHLQTHSILRKVPGKKKYEYKSYKSYKCRLCNKPYSSYISYKRHVQCHGLSKKCKICEKEFDTVPILLMHVARAHKTTHADVLGELYPSLTKYKCEHCPKTFSGKQGLKFHIEHKHLGIYRYVCPICNKTFQLEINLKSHMATHASKEAGERPLKCPYCPSTYSYMPRFRHHVKQHKTGKSTNKPELLRRKRQKKSKK